MEKYKCTEEKVFSFIKKHNIFEPGDKVVAGVSGGADSVCLLFMLLELRKRLPISVQVVHINHCIRQEAAQDAAYVEKLCRENDIPFLKVDRDVRKLAGEQHCSEEEMGRLVRYEAFRQAAQQCGGKIAVAHNMNDKSETMLFNLFRGSGIKGLGSIRPVRGDIVRPLLCLERSEIEEYLRERNITYCTDATNDKDDYTRNRIRHHILPYAEEQIASGSIRHAASAADELGEIDEYLEQQTDKLMAGGACAEKTDAGYILDVEELKREHEVIVRRLIYRILYELSPHAKDITARHVAAVTELLSHKGNATLDLPFGINVRLRYGKIYLSQGADAPENGINEENQFGAEAALKLDIIDCDGQMYKEVPQKKYTKWFDCDKIEQTPVLRYRQQGDYISVAGSNGEEIHKSLKKFFIDEKIPSEYRNRIKLLADGRHIIWVVGYRISEHYKVTENTKHILRVQLDDVCMAEETED